MMICPPVPPAPFIPMLLSFYHMHSTKPNFKSILHSLLFFLMHRHREQNVTMQIGISRNSEHQHDGPSLLPGNHVTCIWSATILILLNNTLHLLYSLTDYFFFFHQALLNVLYMQRAGDKETKRKTKHSFLFQWLYSLTQYL